MSATIALDNAGAVRLAHGRGGTSPARRTLAWHRRHGLEATAARVRALYRAGQDRLDWYHGATDELMRLYGTSATDVARIIAACSPLCSVEHNVKRARFVWGLLAANGELPNKVTLGPAAPGILRNIHRVWHEGLPPSGPKCEAFARAILGDVNAVVVDSWMLRAFFGSERHDSTGQRGLVIAWIEYLAGEAGESPRDVQAAIWAGIKRERGGRADAGDAPLRDYIGRFMQW